MTTTTAALRRADRDARLEVAPAPSRRRVVLVLGALITAAALPSTASATVTKSTVAVPPSPS